MLITAVDIVEQTPPDLDTTILLIVLATTIFAVALAQLCVLIIGSYVKNRARRNKSRNSNGTNGDNNLLP